MSRDPSRIRVGQNGQTEAVVVDPRVRFVDASDSNTLRSLTVGHLVERVDTSNSPNLESITTLTPPQPDPVAPISDRLSDVRNEADPENKGDRPETKAVDRKTGGRDG